MLQNSTLWTWQETFEFCEIRKISWPGQSLPDSQDVNFMESENYFITTTVIVVIIIIITIIITGIYIQDPPKKCIHSLTKENSTLYNQLLQNLQYISVHTTI